MTMYFIDEDDMDNMEDIFETEDIRKLGYGDDDEADDDDDADEDDDEWEEEDDF